MKDILLQHLSELLTGIIAILLGWFGKGKLTKKQENADLTARIQNIYKDMIADTDKRLELQAEEIEGLKKRQKEIDENWKKKIALVEKKWQNKYKALEESFDRYKKEHP